METVSKYIQGNISLPLILSIDKSVNIQWYVYVAFVVHMDMRSHNGGLMTMGIGRAFVQSRKQNMNTYHSTAASLVKVDNILTQLIWT